MDALDCIMSRRTIRRYTRKPVGLDALRAIVDAARMAATAGNCQPWRFVAVADEAVVGKIFPTLGWLKGAGEPPEQYTPTAYVVVLGNPAIFKNYASDCGAAAENIQLAAWALGIGSCWIGSVNRTVLAHIVPVPEGFEIYAVVSLGYPAEEAVLDEKPGTEVSRREDGTLAVQKRNASDIVTEIL